MWFLSQKLERCIYSISIFIGPELSRVLFKLACIPAGALTCKKSLSFSKYLAVLLPEPFRLKALNCVFNLVGFAASDPEYLACKRQLSPGMSSTLFVSVSRSTKEYASCNIFGFILGKTKLAPAGFDTFDEFCLYICTRGLEPFLNEDQNHTYLSSTGI